MEFSPVNHLFDVEKDSDFYHKTVKTYGVVTGEGVILDVLKNNFRSQYWEASKTLSPYRDAYFIEETFGEKKLVHSSDRYSGKDITLGIDKEWRRGTEYQAALNYKKKILNAKIGQTVIWVSPKGDGYVDTQINLAEKVSEKYVSFRQFQSSYLDTSQATSILNVLSTKKAIDEKAELDDVIKAVGISEDTIGDTKVKKLILGITQKEHIPDLNFTEKEINRLSSVNARRYMEAIRFGMEGKALKQYHSKLLFGTFFNTNPIDYMFGFPAEIRTNCSVFEFSGGFMQPMFNMDYYFPPIIFAENKKNWCASCKIENHCTSTCYRCKGFLTSKSSSYL